MPKEPKFVPAKVPLNRESKWPRKVRFIVREISAAFRLAYVAFVESMEQHHNTDVRAQIAADKHADELSTLREANDILRRRMRHIPPRERPHCEPRDRFAILQFHWIHGWPLGKIAKYFIVGIPTLRRWLRKWYGRKDPGLFFGKIAWNRKADFILALVHHFRACTHAAGSRTILHQLEQAGIILSRSTILRRLRERSAGVPPAVAKPPPDAPSQESRHMLKPKAINGTWHVDLTTISILGFQRDLVGILDGFSRKLLALKVFSNTPKTADVLEMVQSATGENGRPRFIVTDHGGQFQDEFTSGVESKDESAKTTHVMGKVRSCKFNGKIERFFRTLKLWQRLSLLVLGTQAIQRHLDTFREWYNVHRCHQGIGGLTPQEMWTGATRPEPVDYLARDSVPSPLAGEGRVRGKAVTASIQRLDFHDDHHLPVYDIKLLKSA